MKQPSDDGFSYVRTAGYTRLDRCMQMQDVKY